MTAMLAIIIPEATRGFATIAIRKCTHSQFLCHNSLTMAQHEQVQRTVPVVAN